MRLVDVVGVVRGGCVSVFFLVTLAIFLFFTFLAVFTSAAPTKGGDCNESKSVPDVPKGTPTVDGSTTPTKPPTVDDDTSDDSDDSDDSNDDVVDTDDITTLATSATYSGTATWFEVGLGACGFTDQDSDFIVALASPNWGGGSHCNQKLQITNSKNKRTQTATVRDLCPGCSSGDLDMSPSLFEALADDLGLGVFEMTWNYV